MSRTIDPRHISLPADRSQLGGPAVDLSSCEPDGICHCDPQPESGGLGECPRCHRLDLRKASWS